MFPPEYNKGNKAKKMSKTKKKFPGIQTVDSGQRQTIKIKVVVIDLL